MILVIQDISTHWSKLSRGGKYASLRNSIPEALPIQYIPETQSGLRLLHHRVVFSESKVFESPFTEVVSEELSPEYNGHFGCTEIEVRNNKIFAKYAHNWNCGGAPMRWWSSQTVQLALGTWIRIRSNGRFSKGWESYWTYHKTVLNIGYFKRLPINVFFSNPSQVLDDMAVLR